MRLLLILLAVAAGVYLLLLAALYVGQRALLFPASGAAVSAAEAGLAGFTDAVIETSDGERLAAYWKPPEPGRALVLYFHGNGGNLFARRFRARALAEGGRGVLVVSYRGYAGSTGSPTEAGLRLDALAAYDQVAARYEAPRIVLYGESLGTGVAVRLATERPVGGVILDAPYTSTADIAKRVYGWVPVDLLMRDPFRSLDIVGRLRAPLLVLHGERDGVIPIAFGERLFAAAPEPKRFVRLPGIGHEGVLEAALPAVRAFLAEVESRIPAPPAPAEPPRP